MPACAGVLFELAYAVKPTWGTPQLANKNKKLNYDDPSRDR